MANNNVESRARQAERKSKSSRPATSGNKNLQSRASRKGAQVPTGMVGRTHKGPDLGDG